MRPIGAAAGLTPMQLACQWNLAHAPVACAAPTLIQEAGPEARPIEDKRAELAALPPQRLGVEEFAEVRRIGDNRGSMTLKGASPEHEGEERPDRWELSSRLIETARRWDIDPDSDLRRTARA